jgi:hypothetical protein
MKRTGDYAVETLICLLIAFIYNFDIMNIFFKKICILGTENLFRGARNFDTSNFEKMGVNLRGKALKFEWDFRKYMTQLKFGVNRF